MKEGTVTNHLYLQETMFSALAGKLWTPNEFFARYMKSDNVCVLTFLHPSFLELLSALGNATPRALDGPDCAVESCQAGGHCQKEGMREGFESRPEKVEESEVCVGPAV